jgi:hypothetical protein
MNPHAHLQPDGSNLLNLAGCARLAYEADPEDVEPGARRERLTRFRVRVDRARESRRAMGLPSDLTSTLASVCRLDELAASVRARRITFDQALDRIVDCDPAAADALLADATKGA